MYCTLASSSHLASCRRTDAVNDSLDVAEMVFAFVDGMLTDPEQRVRGRRGEGIDAAALQLHLIKRLERLGDEAGCGGELSGDLLRVLRVIARQRHTLVPVHRDKAWCVFHQRRVETVALHEEHVTHVTGVLERGPYVGGWTGAQDGIPRCGAVRRQQQCPVTRAEGSEPHTPAAYPACVCWRTTLPSRAVDN